MYYSRCPCCLLKEIVLACHIVTIMPARWLVYCLCNVNFSHNGFVVRDLRDLLRDFMRAHHLSTTFCDSMNEESHRQVCIASNPQALGECYGVLGQHGIAIQGPHQLDAKTYMMSIENMRRHGFQVAYVRNGHQSVVSVATYLLLPLLTGKQLQIHHFATDVHHRGHGYGKTLMDWLIAKAEAERCTEVVLHTSCEAHAQRQQAFLLCKGFVLDGFRFTLRFDDER